MTRRRSAIRVLLSAWIALSVAGGAAFAQEREWGKRTRPEEGDSVKIETVTCPVCDAKCERVSYSGVSEYEWDTDFKVVRASLNVYPYVLLTCPKCSYSTYSAQFHKTLTPEQRKAVSEALKDVRREFRDVWSVPLSLTVRAAIMAHRALNSAEGTLFEIHLLGAYLARDAKEAAAERDMQQRAVQSLGVAIEKDEAYQRSRMRYLAGEICRRIDLHKEALDWFAKARVGAEPELEKLITRQELATRDAMEKKPKK